MLRYEVMARKIRNIIVNFEEMDLKDAHKNGRFLRINLTLDLMNPLKRGTVVNFKEKAYESILSLRDCPHFILYVEDLATNSKIVRH